MRVVAALAPTRLDVRVVHEQVGVVGSGDEPVTALRAEELDRADRADAPVAASSSLRSDGVGVGADDLDRQTAVVGGLDHLGDADLLLELSRRLAHRRIDERDHDSGGAGAGSAARTVVVGGRVGRRIEVQHTRDAVDVNAAGRDIGGDERPTLPRLNASRARSRWA